jgi:hypothetical protein
MRWATPPDSEKIRYQTARWSCKKRFNRQKSRRECPLNFDQIITPWHYSSPSAFSISFRRELAPRDSPCFSHPLGVVAITGKILIIEIWS